MAQDVQVSIGADAGPLAAAMRQAQVTVNEATASMQGAFERVASSVNLVGKAMAAITAVLAGGAAFKSAIDATVNWDTTAGKLARTLGVSTQQASVYQVALHSIGSSSDVLTTATLKMSKQIATNSDAFDKLGIATRDSNGHLRAAGDVLQDALARLREIKNPIDQNIAGMALFGKGWADIRPLMKLTSDVMDEAAKRAKELGLIVGPEGAAQAKEYQQAMRDVQLVGESFQIQIGRALLPALTQLGAALGSELPRAGEILGSAFKGVIIVFETLWNSIQKVSLAVGAYFAAYAAILHGDKEGAKSIWKAYGEDVDELNRKLTTFYERMANPPPPPKSPDEPDTHDTGEADLLGKDKRRAQIEELSNFAMELDTRVTEMHSRLIEKQRADDDRKAKEEERQLEELSSFAQELDTRVTTQHSAALRERAQLEQRLAKESEQRWASLGRAISGSLAGVFQGLLNGTMTIRNAFQNMASAIGNSLANLAAQNLAHMAEQVLMGRTAAMAQIKQNAATAASAAYKAVVGIPYIGPFLAPPAAAVAYAGTIAFGAQASAAQGYDIPAGVNPVTQLHAEEMVLPRPIADIVRQRMAGDGGNGGSGGGDTHIHVNLPSAIDSKSFDRYINDPRIRDSLAKSLRKSFDRGSPHLR